MFNINDIVLYSCYGVCEITEITNKDFGGEKVEYYTLKPVYDKKSTLFFVPVNNEKLTSKIKPVMTADEAYSLIRIMPEKEAVWIEDDNKRKERYKEILTGADREEIVKMIKSLYYRQKQNSEFGKKLHAVDEKFFKDAEKLLYEEFSHVLNIDKQEVEPFIAKYLKEN